MKKELHLCDDCIYSLATCQSKIELGAWWGADNVIKCDIHEPIKL